MIITFVHHSCFTVEMEEHFFVFDYFRGERVGEYSFQGVLPPFPEHKKVIVFASHSHHDHFDSEILKWTMEDPRIRYVLSKDIRLGNNYLEKNDIPPRVRERITWVRPLESYTVEDIQIMTLRSTDSGVAFIVTAEGKNIYHAGDLNLWKWEGVGELINGKEARDYKREINRIVDKKIHLQVAFLPMDTRQREYATEGIDYFMKNVEVDAVFPMHMWQDYSLIQKYKSKISNGDFANRIVEIEGENETYEL